MRRYARRWSKERGQSTAAAYVPLSLAPGERAVHEEYDAFEARVIAEANAAGLKSVVIGGLPPHDINLGTLEEFLSSFDFPEVPQEQTSR